MQVNPSVFETQAKMTPVIPCSTNNFLLTPGTSFAIRKNNYFTRSRVLVKFTKQKISSQIFILPVTTSVWLFPLNRACWELNHQTRTFLVSAIGTDVDIEEADASIANEAAVSESSEIPSDSAVTNGESEIKSNAGLAGQSKRPRPGRKSEMPPVKTEELIPGATFTGKVRSIQPFGAFVDFGAFTDGLVHVSQLSDTFVKDVGSFVSVGQEVTVRLVEANSETGRISLSMRSDDSSKQQPRTDSSSSSDRPRTPRRNTQRKDDSKKVSKFVKGQELQGTVKNLTRSGAFISLPEGEEGFLPQAEEVDEGFANVMGGSSLQIGQEITVRVLRLNRGQVTLTMKTEEDAAGLDTQLNYGVVHVATNPFLVAFRQNKEISQYLDEREKVEAVKAPTNSEGLTTMPAKIVDNLEESETSTQEVDNTHVDPENIISDTVESADASLGTTEVENEVASDILAPEANVADADEKKEEFSTEDEVSMQTVETGPASASLDEEVEPVEENSSVISSSSGILEDSTVDESSAQESVVSEAIEENQGDVSDTKDESEIQIPAPENGISAAPLAVENIGPLPVEKNSSDNSNSQIGIPSTVESSIKETEVREIRMENQDDVGDTKENATPALVESSSSTSSNVETNNPSEDSTTKASISPTLVKQLREETGAGMMDCKKALSETGGDVVKAQEFLRKKGLASADKKSSRTTAEGRIGSYIHDSRIGVLIEVNCETDFVSRGDIFKELVEDLAMQVAACPQVQHLVTEDVPQEVINKEREIEMQKEDLLSKPEQFRSKIVEGRINKRLAELALLEQPFIKNDKVTVKDWVKQTIATIGENIKVKRFVRYNLGEGLEKKSQDFAAEVAAQTAAKSTSSPVKEQPAPVEANQSVEKPPTVAVSAALVKQLREETGAGMMDCKKALAETGGDLEKAQEYLRKKGLSSADKKSSRLAVEGRIGSYIHDTRIGVLIEVNCETDFVGRSENFKELVDDLAMQAAAFPQVQYVSIEDIPDAIARKEKELEMQREDLQSKPENIREKIVEGRISKRLGELALLEQPFIKNDSILVKDLVKQTIAALGENIKVRRFVRFTLGEDIENTAAETNA